MNKIIIGVTGGFSSGKSTVASLIADKGAYKIDADEITHIVLENDPEVRSSVIGIFGDEILVKGKIDRRKLGDIVFNDRVLLNSLCAIIHPFIFERIDIEASAADDDLIVIDAPLLIESGLYKNVDYIVVVSAHKTNQMKRARARGYPDKTTKNIISNQYSIAEKIKSADFVLKNDFGIDKLKQGVDELWQILKGKKKKSWI